MEMNWLESLLYGVVSGFTEFLPISMQAHQSALLRLIGSQNSPLLQLMIRVAVLAALIVSIKDQLNVLYREMRLAAVPKRRRRRPTDMKSVLDIKLIKTAFYPLLIGFIFYPLTSQWHGRLNIIAAFLLLNGFILFIPQFFPMGNKDSRSVSALDGILFGLTSAVAVLPGVSRIAAGTTICALIGADRKQSFQWSLLLTIPAFCFLIGFDIQSIFISGSGIQSFFDFLQCCFAAVAAYGGACASIKAMQFIAVNSGFSGFAYYCWGAALFIFVLFLTI